VTAAKKTGEEEAVKAIETEHDAEWLAEMEKNAAAVAALPEQPSGEQAPPDIVPADTKKGETKAKKKPAAKKATKKKPAAKKAKKKDEKKLTAAEKAAADHKASYAPERKTRVAAFLKTVGQAGDVVAARADQIEYPWDLRRPSGVAGLDVDMAGGPPAGALTQYFGPDGAGKTLLGYLNLAQAQRNYGNNFIGVYASHGVGFDRAHARMAGNVIPFTQVELARAKRNYFYDFHHEMPPDIENELLRSVGEFLILEIGEGKLADEKPSEVLLDSLIDIVGRNVAQIVFLDEAAGTVATADRIAKPLSGEKAVRTADQSALMSETLRKMTPALKKRFAGRPNETTILFACQRRVNIQTGRPNPKAAKFKEAGGTALAHYKVGDIKLRKEQAIEVDGREIGRRIEYHITKGKLGFHEGAKGLFEVRFSRPGLLDFAHDIGVQGKKRGIIRQNGATFNIHDIDGSIVVQDLKGGLKGVQDFLRRNETFLDHVRTAIFQTLKDPCRFT
jgi:RecA/RadA recombinase